MSTIQETFEKAFHHELSFSSPGWFPALGSLITFDDESKLVNFSLDHYEEKNRADFVDHLNLILGKRKKPDMFSLLKKEDGTNCVTFSYETLEKLASPEMEENGRQRYLIMLRYYDRFLNHEAWQIASRSVNFKREERDPDVFQQATEFLRFDWADVPGKVEQDLFLVFSRSELGWPPIGYHFLAERMEASIANLSGFLKETSQLSQEQRAKLDAGLLDDITNNLFVRLKSGHDFLPAISLKVAQAMHECGINIDLGAVFAAHFLEFDDDRAFRWEENKDATRAFAKAFNLTDYADQKDLKLGDQVIGSLNAEVEGSSTHNLKRGETVNPAPGYVSLNLKYVTRDDVTKLTDAFNAACGDQEIFKQDLKYNFMKMNYEHVDDLLQSGKTIDLSGAFKETADLISARLATAQSALDSLGDAIGYRGFVAEWYPDNFYEYPETDSRHVAKLTFKLENIATDTTLANADPLDMRQAQKIYEILQDAIVSNTLKLTGSAEDDQFLKFAVEVRSIQDIEKLTAKLAPYTERLKPLMATMVAGSTVLNGKPLPAMTPVVLPALTVE